MATAMSSPSSHAPTTVEPMETVDGPLASTKTAIDERWERILRQEAIAIGRSESPPPPRVDSPVEGRALKPLQLVATELTKQANRTVVPEGCPSPHASLPLFRTDHERTLLVQCGPVRLADGTAATPRACTMGSSCMGHNQMIAGHEESGGGITLREALTPSELREFETNGASPDCERRMCVLCSRYHMMRAYLKVQSDVDGLDAIHTVNWYENVRGAAGGYRSDLMCPLEGTTSWRNVSGSFAQFKASHLRLVKDASVNLWRVDQSAMEYVEPSELNISRARVTAPSDFRPFLEGDTCLLAFFERRVFDHELLFDAVLDVAKRRLSPAHAGAFRVLGDAYVETKPESRRASLIAALEYRVYRLETLLLDAKLYPMWVAQRLLDHLDAHVPLVVRVRREWPRTKKIMPALSAPAGALERATVALPALPDVTTEFVAIAVSHPLSQSTAETALASACARTLQGGKAAAGVVAILSDALRDQTTAQSKKHAWRLLAMLRCIVVRLCFGTSGQRETPDMETRVAVLERVDALLQTPAAAAAVIEHQAHADFVSTAVRWFTSVVIRAVPSVVDALGGETLVRSLCQDADLSAASMRGAISEGVSERTNAPSAARRTVGGKSAPGGAEATGAHWPFVEGQSAYKRSRAKSRDRGSKGTTVVRRRRVSVDRMLILRCRRAEKRDGVKRGEGFSRVDYALAMRDLVSKHIGMSVPSLRSFESLSFTTSADVRAFEMALHDWAVGAEQRSSVKVLTSTLHRHVDAMAADVRERVENFLYARELCASVNLVPLCAEWANTLEKKCHARFPKASHEEAERRCACMRMCMCCHSLKSFVLTQPTARVSHGYVRCCKRADGKWACAKKAGSDACKETEILSIPLLRRDDNGACKAFALRVNKAVYAASPCCATLCDMTQVRRLGENAWSCPACVGKAEENQKKIVLDIQSRCAYCNTPLREATAGAAIVWLLDPQGKPEMNRFCKRHWRRWMLPKDDGSMFGREFVFAKIGEGLHTTYKQ